MCKALTATGVDVEVFTTTANGSGPDLPAAVQAPRNYEGVPVWYFPRELGSKFFRAPGMREALRKAIPGVDLVHIHTIWNWVEWTAVRESVKAGVPYVISPRGMLEASAMRHRRWRKAVAFPLLERRNLGRAAFLHATAATEYETLDRLALGVRSVLVPNAVDGVLNREDFAGILRKRIGVRPDVPIVAWLGRIHPIKRLDLLAEAFRQVHEHIPAHLVIAGPDETGQRQSLEGLLRGIASDVHWLGELNDAQKRELLSDANVLVLCSNSESFGMSVLEALAAGTPVVVTRTCPWQEVESAGCGFWVEQEAQAMAKALLDILSDPILAATMGKKAQQLVRSNYSWDVAALKMVKYYSQSIAGALSP
jgi:glycosyltransferase involved in cell wall biosynthesis